METNRQDIDNLFKNELGSYTETPPPPVWDALEKRLNGRRKRKFPYGWFWYISLISFVVLLGASVLWKITGHMYTNANIAASTNNAVPQQPATPANTTATAKTMVANSNKIHEKNKIQQHTKTITLTANASQKGRTTIHRSNKKKNNEQINTTQKNSKTNDDLYADVDDDQYTIGYSSNARKNNGPSAENDNDVSGYEMQERSQGNIAVAQMEPQQNVRETNYAATPSIKEEEEAFKIKNEKIAFKSDKALAVNNAHTLAAKTLHKHKVTGTNTIIAHNAPANKPVANTALAVTKDNKNKYSTISRKVVPVNVIAAAKPVIKTKSIKQVVAVTGAEKNEQKASGNINTQLTKKVTTVNKTTNHKVAAKSIVAITTTKDNKPVLPAKHTNPQTIVNANTPAAKTGAIASTGSTPEHAGQKKKTTHNNQVKPPTNNYASVNDVKSGKKHKKAHKVISQPVAQNNVPVTAAKTTITKNSPSGNKQPKIKDDKKITAPVAIGAAVAKTPVKNKQLPATGKAIVSPSTKTVATKEKKTEKALTGKDRPGVDKNAPVKHKAIAKTENKHRKKGTAKKTSANTASNNNNNNVAGITSVAPQPPVNVYSSFSKRTIAGDAATIDNLQVNNFIPAQPLTPNTTTLPGTFKQEENAPKTDSLAKTETVDSAAKHRSFFSHFEAGIKGGYETGFNKNAANKFVVSPYIQYNLTSKFAIMTQPSIKESQLGNVSVGSPKSYYNTTKTDSTFLNSGVVIIIPGGAPPIMNSEYKYTETYDSIVKSYNLARTYTEFEMPLLLKYKIYKQLSIYGGVNMLYSKVMSVNDNSYTSGPLTKSVIGDNLYPSGATPPTPGSATSFIHFAYPSYATYKGPLPSPTGDLLRYGYMLGFSYEYKKKWLFDALVQQAAAKANTENGYNTNTPLSLPYFRFTIGYKLTK